MTLKSSICLGNTFFCSSLYPFSTSELQIFGIPSSFLNLLTCMLVIVGEAYLKPFLMGFVPLTFLGRDHVYSIRNGVQIQFQKNIYFYHLATLYLIQLFFQGFIIYQIHLVSSNFHSLKYIFIIIKSKNAHFDVYWEAKLILI